CCLLREGLPVEGPVQSNHRRNSRSHSDIIFFNRKKAKPLFRGQAGRGSEIPSCKKILPHAPTAGRIPLKRLSPWADIGLAFVAAGVRRTSTRSAFRLTSFWISSKICNIS